ncbi:ABZJ_00895 family protein [Mesorhizobium sp. PAMC28654]|uniref:ABZJ_00895 family protein n=1 Tax=Mesorhizobium sp. PAMC28654 TaxID=2880934 RepID=UPI001D09C707|nr:ABZJ_00895 family protein [Mesorhizobium sp. PAMC28654]UDL88635.1 ABZJ_00895 family protein [Mesorhizobium sp. PAMC28654]
MSNGDTRTASVWPCVGYYTLAMVALTITLGIGLVAIPSLSKDVIRAAGFSINYGSTKVASYKFIKRNGRLFSREEYWIIVLLSTLAACLISAIQGWLALVGGTAPQNLSNVPVAVWVGSSLFAFLLVFGLNAAGYSGRFGRDVLKAELARRARIDTETFR